MMLVLTFLATGHLFINPSSKSLYVFNFILPWILAGALFIYLGSRFEVPIGVGPSVTLGVILYVIINFVVTKYIRSRIAQETIQNIS